MTETYKQLTKEIKEHDHIFIMAHKNIDLDGLGSALCLYDIIRSFKKNCYVVLDRDEKQTAILKAFAYLKNDHFTFDMVSKENYASYINNDSIVFVLDTQKKDMVECSELIDTVGKCIVIDHHIKSGNTINPVIFSYIDVSLSSMNEFMTGYLKYLNKTVPNSLATIMLAGIEVDTNGFNTKTNIETYESAAFLAHMGADNIVKQELLQEKKELYMKRQNIAANSFRFHEIYEICVLDDDTYERKDLALLALELLKFEGVEVSFAIGKTSKTTVGISARSLGRVDVERFMSQLGGGGHITDAAAQLEGKTIDEVKELLLNVIK